MKIYYDYQISTSTQPSCRVLTKSVLAGIFIGLAALGYAYLGHALGTILFPLGIWTCMKTGSQLYTGKTGLIPYIYKDNGYSFIPLIFFILLWNLLGVLTITLYNSPALVHNCQEIVNHKLQLTSPHVLTRAFCCNSLVTLGIYLYHIFSQNNKSSRINIELPRWTNEVLSFVFLWICISLFVATRCEHSVADVYYFFSAGLPDGSCKFLTQVVLGNLLGGYVTGLLISKFESPNVH